MKRNVLPNLSSSYFANVSMAKAVFFSDLPERSFVPPDCDNVLFVNFCQVVIGTLYGTLSSLENHVIAIILKRSKKKVIGIYAWWVIAMVKKLHSIWNWTFMQNPRNMMSKTDFSVILDRSVEPWLAPNASTFPHPTSRYGINFYEFKKAFFYGKRSVESKPTYFSKDATHAPFWKRFSKLVVSELVRFYEEINFFWLPFWTVHFTNLREWFFSGEGAGTGPENRLSGATLPATFIISKNKVLSRGYLCRG
jgi:hypothetical protein